MSKLRELIQRTTAFQRFMLVISVVWLLVLVPEEINLIRYKHKVRGELWVAVHTPECREYVDAPESAYSKSGSRSAFRGTELTSDGPCHSVVSMKTYGFFTIHAPRQDSFDAAVERSRNAIYDTLGDLFNLAVRFVVPLLVIYAIGAVIGWIFRGRRTSA
ncbi:hypothetical protein [Ideonella sp.]|uniref:hypothetical protein n=1 Tax=Ideonella sp. TaxID=1929293 RepID=UPI0035B0C8C0